jgi:hypothetical protein
VLIILSPAFFITLAAISLIIYASSRSDAWGYFGTRLPLSFPPFFPSSSPSYFLPSFLILIAIRSADSDHYNSMDGLSRPHDHFSKTFLGTRPNRVPKGQSQAHREESKQFGRTVDSQVLLSKWKLLLLLLKYLVFKYKTIYVFAITPITQKLPFSGRKNTRIRVDHVVLNARSCF